MEWRSWIALLEALSLPFSLSLEILLIPDRTEWVFSINNWAVIQVYFYIALLSHQCIAFVITLSSTVQKLDDFVNQRLCAPWLVKAKPWQLSSQIHSIVKPSHAGRQSQVITYLWSGYNAMLLKPKIKTAQTLNKLQSKRDHLYCNEGVGATELCL